MSVLLIMLMLSVLMIVCIRLFCLNSLMKFDSVSMLVSGMFLF